MWLRTRCDIRFNLSVPTPFVLMLRPRSGAQQWVAREEYRLVPSLSAVEFTDGFGNLCQRVTALPPEFAVYTTAEVMTADMVDQAPGITYGCLPGYDQAAAITGWVHSNIIYRPGDSDLSVSAVEVNARQWGVCRDAADVAVYNQFGPTVYPVEQTVVVERIPDVSQPVDALP